MALGTPYLGFTDFPEKELRNQKFLWRYVTFAACAWLQLKALESIMVAVQCYTTTIITLLQGVGNGYSTGYKIPITVHGYGYVLRHCAQRNRYTIYGWEISDLI
jgi:hypothetical protein